MGSRFAAEVGWRVACLTASLVAVTYLLVATRLVAVALIIAAVAAAQVWALVRYVHRTNRELTRFLGALRYDDYQQTFTLAPLGGSFADLDRTFTDVMTRFRDARLAREAQRRYLEALVEHVPVAILAVRPDGTVELLNNAARRLLDASRATTLADLVAYGAAFQRDIGQAKAGDRTLTRTEIDGAQRHLVLSTTQIAVTGEVLRLVTLHDIQAELDTNELSAWQDMASVLSHEIMNSLTPIASLARTADELVDDLARRAGAGDELVGDIHDAIQTVARRSDGLMRFVRSYREVTQLPPPAFRPVALDDCFARLARLMQGEWTTRGIELTVGAPAGGITVLADDSLLDQAIINLLRNAADAAASSPAPQVWLDARLSDRGRPVIEIADNGPGVDTSLGDTIYLPFFTTKPHGSGIGLALARQVMLVHKGAITASTRPGGGALFRLTF
jgi:two-component system, NtrC family, nitrogen regulation sensor histidine kinase NtrY